jgi:predicted O-methyltransferase YrrM/uncharacterized damage-inducible protein DinB
VVGLIRHNARMSQPVPQQSLWSSVDRALQSWLAPEDAALTNASDMAARAGLPEIAVAPAQGRLLEVLARAVGARRILEIGTLAGYSAIWMARALPADGELVTLELDPSRAQLARDNIARARIAAGAQVIAGPALDSLSQLRAAATPPFDLIFIDADKENCPAYLEHALALSRNGTLIIVDNVIRRGRLIDGTTGDASVDGVRTMMDAIARHPRLAAAGVQTVGAKGYDGILLALVGPQRTVPERTAPEPTTTERTAPEPSAPVPSTPARYADPLDILLEHNVWATHEVLRACSQISDSQWHQRFEIGLGSLHDTVTHIVGAMFRWADRIDGPPRALRPCIENGTRRTPIELASMLDAAARDLSDCAARARQRGLAHEMDLTLGGVAYRFTLGAMLVHVTTHGMHHRAQCLNMLRHLRVPGVSDRLPEIDVLERDARYGLQ